MHRMFGVLEKLGANAPEKIQEVNKRLQAQIIKNTEPAERKKTVKGTTANKEKLNIIKSGSTYETHANGKYVRNNVIWSICTSHLQRYFHTLLKSISQQSLHK